MKDQQGVGRIQVGGSLDEGKMRREIGELVGRMDGKMVVADQTERRRVDREHEQRCGEVGQLRPQSSVVDGVSLTEQKAHAVQWQSAQSYQCGRQQRIQSGVGRSDGEEHRCSQRVLESADSLCDTSPIARRVRVLCALRSTMVHAT